jgi:hypothetical protein
MRLISALVVSVVSCLAVAAPASAAASAKDGWRAGAARVRITPEQSLWMTGFAARNGPSRGKLTELYVKALALEDVAGSGQRSVLVTSDLLGFPRPVADDICREVQKRYGVPRERILLNSSHTHGAPSIASPVQFIYGPRVTDEQRRDIERYTEKLKQNVVEVIGSALGALAPARLSFTEGQADFGVNRRKITPQGVQGFTPNPDGPVDRAVPVLRVDAIASGNEGGSPKTIAIVFGYAAHPTTVVTGNDYYKYSGDYPAFAQEALEAAHPGATAMFVEGCAGDVMVFPRGTVELAKKYGAALATSVETAMAGPSVRSVGGPLHAKLDHVTLEFATPLPTREKLEEGVKSKDVYESWHARELLKALDRDGKLPSQYEYTVQAWQFGGDLTLVALAGEVVSDYSLQLKKSLGGGGGGSSADGPRVWVAGYSNDLCCYIPTRRVLAEGGYEADRSMWYYMHPTPWAPSIEDAILNKARETAAAMRGEK